MKMARIGVGLSQAEIADKLGVNINTYGRWEKDPESM
jgi:DNA-binding XRE family transcriptional regulator